MPKRPNILIIDPNQQDIQLLEISLRNMGFAVTTATNNFDALKKIEIFPPDLIVSETQLEDFDGFTLCRNIKENTEWAHIPFIFLSTDKNLQSKVKGLQLGTDDYLTKPIFLVELVARIRMLMQKRERESIEKQESRTRFTGALAEIGLVDIIQTIDLSKKKGVVHLARNGDTGAIYFEDGIIVDAELAQLDGEEAVFRMMRWPDGFFDIEFRSIRRDKKIKLNSQQLLMEGLRRLDEWNRILEQLPPMETIFNVDVLELIDRLDEVPDEVNGLVSLFDGHRSLKEIVNNDIFSDLDTLRIVSKLIFFGVLVEHEQKVREIKEEKKAEEIIVGKKEEPRRRKSTDTQGVAPVPPADLKFGKAEEVDVLEVPEKAAAAKQAEAKAAEAKAAEAKAAEAKAAEAKAAEAKVAEAKVAEAKAAEAKAAEAKVAKAKAAKVEVAEDERETLARIDVKKIPVEIISGKDELEEEVTLRKEFIKGKEVIQVPEAKKEKDVKVEKAAGVQKEGTIRIKAAQVPASKEEKGREPAKAEEEKPKEEALLGAIDTKLKKIKKEKEEKEEKPVEEGKAKEEAKVEVKEAARKEEGKEEVKKDERDAKTARMFGDEKAGEGKKDERILSEKKTARWTFPSVAEGKGKEEKAVEEKPKEEEAARREMVQAISLKEVKEEIDKRGKEPEKKPPLSDSGAYQVEEKAFFRSAPEGAEPVDTFEDLVGDEKRKKGTTGLTYAVWTIIILGIAAVLFFAFGRDYFKQGPDLTLLEKLDKVDKVETISAPPLRETSLQKVSPMEGVEEGEEEAPPEEEAEEGEPAEAAGEEAEAEEGEPEAGEEPTAVEEATVPPAVTPQASDAYGAIVAEAKTLLEQKKKKAALDKYQEAVNLNPNGQEALSFLVDYYKENPKHPDVLAWGKKATELGPNDSRAWFGYGLALFIREKKEEAKAAFEQCIKIKPPDANVNRCRKMLKWVK